MDCRDARTPLAECAALRKSALTESMFTEFARKGSALLGLILVGGVLAGCALMQPTDPYEGTHVDGPPPGAPGQEHSVLGSPAPHAQGTPGAPAVTGGGSSAPARPLAAGEALDLERVIEIALAGNPELAATAWDVAAARARRDQSAGARQPRFGIVGAYNHHVDEQRLLPVKEPGDPAVLSRDIISGDLVFSMAVITGGRLHHQLRAAERLEQAAGYRLARTREELILDVSALFYSILAQEEVVESLAFARRTMEEHLRRVDALITAHKAAGVDRLRTEVRLADVDQRLARERSALAIERRTLANLLGVAGEVDELTLRGELDAPLEEGLPELADLPAVLTAARVGRADYQAARAALEAQAHRVDAARAGHWPSIYLQGSYGGRWAVGDWTGAGDELDDTGRVGLALEMPLFEGGQIAARVREERARLAADQQRLRHFDLQIRLEVESALHNLASTRERTAALARAIDQAHEGLRIERQKYELGKGAIVDVLDAQAALLESQTNYFRVLAELRTAQALLRLATGGAPFMGEPS